MRSCEHHALGRQLVEVRGNGLLETVGADRWAHVLSVAGTEHGTEHSRKVSCQGKEPAAWRQDGPHVADDEEDVLCAGRRRLDRRRRRRRCRRWRRWGDLAPAGDDAGGGALLGGVAAHICAR